MLIDAHQHFWNLADRTGHWPPPELQQIYRDFTPEDLEPLIKQAGIEGTVLVQSIPTIADTQFMLNLADSHPFILGVVGWADLKAPDAPAQIAELARHPKLKGLRPMLQSLEDDYWIDDAALAPAVAAMLEHQLAFDALVLPKQLQGLLGFAQRFPALPIVIDHAAKPLIADGATEPWLSHMRALAKLPQICCKLSGLLTEAGTKPSSEAVRPYAEAVLELFGAERILWGSDWPVLRLAGDYSSWLAMSRSFCKSFSSRQLSAIFGENAARFYRLNPAV